MRTLNRVEQQAHNQQHPRKPVKLWACYLPNNPVPVYQHSQYNFCAHYKKTYNPKLKIKPVE